MKEDFAVGLEFPEEQPNWENIQFTKSYGVFPDMKRFKKALINSGFTNTKEIVDEYYEGRLKDYRGLGKTFYTLLKDFIFNQKKYFELSEKINQEEGEKSS